MLCQSNSVDKKIQKKNPRHVFRLVFSLIGLVGYIKLVSVPLGGSELFVKVLKASSGLARRLYPSGLANFVSALSTLGHFSLTVSNQVASYLSPNGAQISFSWTDIPSLQLNLLNLPIAGSVTYCKNKKNCMKCNLAVMKVFMQKLVTYNYSE